MLRNLAIALVTAALGIGAALGVAACGEDREGDVQFEGGTGTSGTSTAGTSTSGTAPSTETVPTETVSTETTPTTDTSGGATAPE